MQRCTTRRGGKWGGDDSVLIPLKFSWLLEAEDCYLCILWMEAEALGAEMEALR